MSVDESSSALVGREASTRAAIWSPSGLNDLGGCVSLIQHLRF